MTKLVTISHYQSKIWQILNSWPKSICQKWSFLFPSGSIAAVLHPFFQLWPFQWVFYTADREWYSQTCENVSGNRNNTWKPTKCQISENLWDCCPFSYNVARLHVNKFWLNSTLCFWFDSPLYIADYPDAWPLVFAVCAIRFLFLGCNKVDFPIKLSHSSELVFLFNNKLKGTIKSFDTL